MKRARVSEGRQPRTDLKHMREGRAKLRTAQARYPQLPPLEALLADLDARQGRLADQSIRNYRQTYLTIAGAILEIEGLSGLQLDEAMAAVKERVYRALPITKSKSGLQGSESGSPQSPNQRASGLDIKTVRMVIADLKRHALARGHMASAWAVFFIVSTARIGWRPWELQGCEIVGKTLWIKNAKVRGGAATMRPFPLDRLPPNSRMAAIVITNCLPDMIWLEAQHWRNGMAEALSNSCDRLNIPRISLYMFRHIAIQSWRSAGISAAGIAALAGHFNLRTATRHYRGRATAGWMEGFHLAEDQLYEDLEPVEPDAETLDEPAPDFEWDDFPVPPSSPEPSAEGARSWKKYADEKLKAPIGKLPAGSKTVRPEPRRGPK